MRSIGSICGAVLVVICFSVTAAQAEMIPILGNVGSLSGEATGYIPFVVGDGVQDLNLGIGPGYHVRHSGMGGETGMDFSGKFVSDQQPLQMGALERYRTFARRDIEGQTKAVVISGFVPRSQDRFPLPAIFILGSALLGLLGMALPQKQML